MSRIPTPKPLYQPKSFYQLISDFCETCIANAHILQFLRIMLHKKMNPQNASRAPSMKKYLEDTKQASNNKNGTEDDREKLQGKNKEGCKWVKTDSECKFTVLAIFIK